MVREILNQTNSVLYDSCEDLDNSIFSDSMIRLKTDSDSEKEKENSNMASVGKCALYAMSCPWILDVTPQVLC